MKKTITLVSMCLCMTLVTYGQKLTQKESQKILEKAWSCVKSSDSSGFIKLWVIDKTQWPFHGGKMFTVNDIKDNFDDFKSYFDVALAKNLKIEEVESDTVEHIDPHYEYAKYYIKGWFKYSPNYEKGFGFYMDYINNQWLIRFSPDYSEQTISKK